MEDMTVNLSKWLILILLVSGTQEFFRKKEGKPLGKAGYIFLLVLEIGYFTI